MADNSVVSNSLFGLIGTIGVAAISGFFVWFTQKKKTSGEAQAIINTGFTSLVDKLSGEIQRQSAEIENLERDVDALRAEVRAQQKTIDTLERYIQDQGLPPAPGAQPLGQY